MFETHTARAPVTKRVGPPTPGPSEPTEADMGGALDANADS